LESYKNVLEEGNSITTTYSVNGCVWIASTYLDVTVDNAVDMDTPLVKAKPKDHNGPLVVQAVCLGRFILLPVVVAWDVF
jgi:hypothetical protein